MAFAYGTSITTPNGTTPIEQFSQGDTVSAWTPDGTVPKEVIFSSGTGDHSAGSVIFIRFGENSLIASFDQPMILADNSIKRADQLIPGVNRLLGANGQSVNIDMAAVEMYTRGIHHIAIDKFDPTGEHRIIANDIVCGDYFMEINSRVAAE